MADNPAPTRSRAGATSRHVATIIQAAEGERAAQYRVQAAEEEAVEIIQEARTEADRLLRDGQAEHEQAKTTATSEALTIMASAQEQADAAIKQAGEVAETSLRESEKRSRELILDAHGAADGVRAEGLELVANLRQMGDSLRSNAERLLRDVQLIHTRMVATLDDAGHTPSPRGSLGRGAARTSTSSSSPSRAAALDGGRPARGFEDQLDVPEFIPPS